MYSQTEINQRLIIIRHSGIDDVIILNENYVHFMRNTRIPEEKIQFEILSTNTQLRIQELKDANT